MNHENTNIEEARKQISIIAEKAKLCVLIIGTDNFDEEFIGKKISKSKKEKLRDTLSDLICDTYCDKKEEAINLVLNKN